MIYRLFIAFFLFVFVIYVLKAIARLRFFINGTMGDVRKLREQLGGAGGGSGGPEMVRCPGCGAFVAAREAVTIRSRNISQSYCSTECLQRHIK